MLSGMQQPISPRAGRIAGPLALAAVAFGTQALGGEIHEYTVQVDPSMSRMRVEANFARAVDSVTARSNDAGDFLLEARNCSDELSIRLRNRRMMLPASGIRCMEYTVDLARAALQQGYNQALAPGNVVVSPSLWLWRPKLAADSEIHIRFVLPTRMQVTVPWPLVDGESQLYRLTPSPESSSAPAVFGNFDYREVKVPGATLKVSILRSTDRQEAGLTPQAITEWLRATATDVSLAYGRFPNPAPQVVVIPVGSDRDAGGSAVPFGRVVRDGGEAVELFVDQSRPLEALLEDWTATHEFSHLMLPYIEQQHRWVSEGFAQYYQNVLLARSGAYDTQKAWQELYEGFERGRKSRPELSPNAATIAGMRSARMKIYWSGAALALMADVTLRERSGGKESLDDVMSRLQSCCLPSRRVWSAPEFFATLDSLADEPVFMPLYRRYADTAGFPDVRPLFARLGVKITDDKVRLQRAGDLQQIRIAITRIDPAAAEWREQLVSRHGASHYRAGN
jgi:M61 glycyl aminopeptidase